MNYAGVNPFNWQMLLKDSDDKYLIQAVQLFCNLDSINLTNIIRAQNELDLTAKTMCLSYDFVSQIIVHDMIERFGSIQACYSSIAKYLFAGDNVNKPSHKQMFWRIFGKIAYQNIINNLNNCYECQKCNMKIPLWTKGHNCPKKASGFFTCADCGTLCQRLNSRQYRCTKCQNEYKKNSNLIYNRQKYRQRIIDELKNNQVK